MAEDAIRKLKQLRAEAEVALDDERLARQQDAHASWFQNTLHFWSLVWRSFNKNRCPLRAAGLAYASLLAMVPMIAVIISVSASLLHREGEEPIQKFIDSLVERMTPSADADTFGPPAPAEAGGVAPGGGLFDPAEYARTREQVAREIRRFVGNIQSGALGVTGMAGLLFVAIGMLSRIEDTFNDIWGITRGRRWVTRVALYWAAITLSPPLLVFTLSLTSGPYFQSTRDWLSGLGPLGAWGVKAGMSVLPYLIWSMAFGVFYALMPNTRVRWSAALMGGVVGGCLWQLNSEFSVLYVSRVVTNSRIYGSLAIIPVFMIGMYVSWVILLFGAQVAYAWQNRRTYLQEKQAESVHQQSREFVALRLAAEVARRFRDGRRPPTQNDLAACIGVPNRLACQIMSALVCAKVVAEVNGSDPAYVPARPLDRITVDDVLLALRVGTGLALMTRDDPTREVIRSEFDRILEAERGVAGRITLEELAAKLGEATCGADHAAVVPARLAGSAA